jgi:peptidoglycan/xylan/chitin deacetylase (PgdA/CDA1 family)
VVLTFDDGHVSNHTEALPVLLERQLTATFFVTAGRIGTGATMSWPQIRELHAAGMEIGSHTMTHRAPSTLDDDELRFELCESKRTLEDGLGAPVTSISSPTGFFNPRMRQVAHEAGYHALCAGRAGLAANDGDPLLLDRIAVKQTTSAGTFDKLLRFDATTIRWLKLHQAARNFAKVAAGRTGYLRVRRALLSVHESR